MPLHQSCLYKLQSIRLHFLLCLYAVTRPQKLSDLPKKSRVRLSYSLWPPALHSSPWTRVSSLLHACGSIRSAAVRTLALVSVACACCSAQTTALSVSAGSGSPGTTVGLSIALNGAAPAGLEWTLKYSTADITSATMAIGSAGKAAGKQMSCTSSAGSSTCLLWGINSTTISSGVVATVALTMSPTTQNTSSSIQLVNGVAAGSNGTAMTTSTAGSTLSIVTAGTSGPVDLSAAFNVIGIVGDDTTFTGGLDGAGNAYSANLLGSTVNAEGTSFTLGSPNVNNVVTNTTVTLPAGQFASLAMLATAVNGNQPSQTFTLTYTDGTTSNFVQSLSDWHTPQNYASESEAASMSYVDLSTGLEQIRTTNLYGYLFALNSTKRVKSIKLPANSNVVVLAMTLTTAPPSPDFSLAVTPVLQTIAAGTGTSYTAVVAKLSGFSGTVALSASGLPT